MRRLILQKSASEERGFFIYNFLPNLIAIFPQIIYQVQKLLFDISYGHIIIDIVTITINESMFSRVGGGWFCVF